MTPEVVRMLRRWRNDARPTLTQRVNTRLDVVL